MSYFSLITRPFQEVLITNEGINTIQFLEATDGLINMFGTDMTECWKKPSNIGLLDLFNSPAFAVVQNDLKSNVQVQFKDSIKERWVGANIGICVENTNQISDRPPC